MISSCIDLLHMTRVPDFERVTQIFQFVNKDAKPGSIANNKNTKDGGLQVNRHVQRVRQLRKQAQLIPETNTTKRLVGWRKAVPERSSGISDSKEIASRSSKKCPRYRFNHDGQSCPRQSIDAPIGSPVDPFKSLVLAIDTKIHRSFAVLHGFAALARIYCR